LLVIETAIVNATVTITIIDTGTQRVFFMVAGLQPASTTIRGCFASCHRQ